MCAPRGYHFDTATSSDFNVILYAHADQPNMGSAGATVKEVIRRKGFHPEAHAWDLLSIALSVIVADVSYRRNTSPDGWTREIELQVAVGNPAFWASQKALLEHQLRFLTTDIWHVEFLDGGLLPAPEKTVIMPEEDCIVLLSGGLDSLVGALDLVTAAGKKPYAVSQVTQGDKEKQAFFAGKIGGGLQHLQLNHNADCPGQHERSQRARSLIFLAYGVLAATALKRYYEGKEVTLYVCENGFISVNPPLTSARLGSLSTRTMHPVFLMLFQRLLDAAGLHLRLENPYRFKTKGEMLRGCGAQDFLHDYAHMATSCGRFARNGYRHCGRCVPCLIRRAAFHTWGVPDQTPYVYAELGRDDDDHGRFDDVRAAAIAVEQVKAEGLDSWLGTSLSTALLGDVSLYRAVVERGLDELGQFLQATGVR
jgi:7-cyano-7-deazaguanine synthase in queuosine biosynthesis